ncbi:MAG: DNA alkylation response protein, partial [Actinomycetota bacterium]|nr:DNA alkylation response protein [Actinomycetota bacterium]
MFSENRPLVEALERDGEGYGRERAETLGKALGGAPLEWGRLANEHPPTLRTRDRYGNRTDEVEFHPAWHSLMQLGIQTGLHALPWREPVPGAHVARAAMFVTWSQVEAGTGCPLSMTFASVPALRAEPKLAARWEPRLTSLRYVAGGVEGGGEEGALCGMAMTERQGGSDVRASTTAARPDGNSGWV